jgi:hypothetical protein
VKNRGFLGIDVDLLVIDGDIEGNSSGYIWLIDRDEYVKDRNIWTVNGV